jgi:hypothetical protein
MQEAQGDKRGKRLKAAKWASIPRASRSPQSSQRLHALRRHRQRSSARSLRRSRKRPETCHDNRAARREDGHRPARRRRGHLRRRARRSCDRCCLMRPHARTARLPLRHALHRTSLACEPPKHRPPARLPPPPAARFRAQAGLSSERSARLSPASVRAAFGAALVCECDLLRAVHVGGQRPRAHAASSCVNASSASNDAPVGGHHSGGRRAGRG